MDFYMPARLLTGREVVRKNADRIAAFGRRCLIVTSGSAAKRCGALDDVTGVLTEKGIAYEVFDGIRPNPSMYSCVDGGRAAAQFGAEFVIGIGGGSALDSAKVIAVFAANRDLDADSIYRMKWQNRALPVILIGTTAGTGSEVTRVAVITDTKGKKHSMHDDMLYAALAFGDPRYTESMPLRVTASTGVDALAHCLESYFSKKANDVSRAFALKGIEQLLKPLENIAAGRIPTAEEREVLYDGSILGGLAICVTGTVMAHNLGYYLTENYGIPHGFACTVFHPALLRHAAACAPEYTAEMLRRVGTDLESLIALIRALTPDPEVSLTAEQIEAILPRWENNGSVKNTIGNVTMEELRQIFTELFSV